MNEIKDTVNGQLQQLQMLMHRTMFSHFRKTHNPHRGQGRVLAILKLKPVISQKELTYLLNMSKQSVAELVIKLEKSGYITRETSEDDKRVMTIRLTEEGVKAADNTDDSEPGNLKILDCLNDDELSVFSEYLGRIIRQYEDRFPDEDFEERRKYMENFMLAHGNGFGHWQKTGHGFGGFGNNHGHDFKAHSHGRDFKGHDHNRDGTGHSPFKKEEDENDENNE